MSAKGLTPMLHVPDVRASIAWYEAIGFKAIDTGDDDGDTVWAELAFGEGRVMLSAGGVAGSRTRRDADLYLYVDDVDARHAGLPVDVEVVEAPHDTFYGMREFIVRDRDGFWLTFGQTLATHARR
jgi:uncharacterized glyoxalase superfamily protein PhnB